MQLLIFFVIYGKGALYIDACTIIIILLQYGLLPSSQFSPCVAAVNYSPDYKTVHSNFKT